MKKLITEQFGRLFYFVHQKEVEVFTEITTLLQQDGFKFEVAYTDQLSLTIKEENERVSYIIQQSMADSKQYEIYIKIKEQQGQSWKELFAPFYISTSPQGVVEHIKNMKEINATAN